MKSTKCTSCGFVGFSDNGNCKACGASIVERTFAPPVAFEPPQERLKQGLAIFSLVLGIISFFTFSLLFVGAIVGIITAAVAMGRVKREPWRYGGRSLAIAGLALSITSLVGGVPVGIIAAIAIPNLRASRMAANEGSAVGSLRQISQAQADYKANLNRYATLEELGSEQLIDPNLASGVRHGYRFTLELKPADGMHPEGFELTAVPLTYRSSGRRSFFIDESLVVRATDNQGRRPSAFDPPLGSDYEYRTRRKSQRELGTDVGY